MVNRARNHGRIPTDCLVKKWCLIRNVSHINHMVGKMIKENLLCSQSMSHICSFTINLWSSFSCIRYLGDNPWIHVSQQANIRCNKHLFKHPDPVIIMCNGNLSLGILEKHSIRNGIMTFTTCRPSPKAHD